MKKLILKRIEEIDNQIAELKEQRKILVDSLGETKVRKKSKVNKKSLCYKLFGKTHKELTPEEKKDYQRVVSKNHYDKKKES